MAEQVRFETADDYADYITRLELVPQMISQTIERLKLGAEEGRTPPRVTLDGLPDQFSAILDDDGLTPLRAPFDRMPDTIDARKRQALLDRYDDQTEPIVRSALERFRVYVVDHYLPACRDTIAASALPDGDAYYSYRLRVMTTTELTAAQIHALGVDEVARIRSEMMDVIRSSDFMERYSMTGDGSGTSVCSRHSSTTCALMSGSTTPSRRRCWTGIPRHLQTRRRVAAATLRPAAAAAVRRPQDPRLHGSRRQTTAYYRRGDMRNAEAGVLLRQHLRPRPASEVRDDPARPARGGAGTSPADRPGPGARGHAGVPQGLRGFTAFGEGWALYSERLGIEMGMYENPYDDFGRLLYEMWRACRLVVDTGVHAFDWSRDQAIEFMLDNSALSRLNIETEVDRYIGWPGQACAYKIGELKIRELREIAETRLGEKFDLREFHDVVLGAGSIPLTVLEKRVIKWTNSQIIVTYD